MVDQLVLHSLGAGTPLLLLNLSAATTHTNSLSSCPWGRSLVIDGRHIIESTILSTSSGSIAEVRMRLIGSLLPLVANQKVLRLKLLPALLLHVHVQRGVLLICAKIVRVLSEPLSVSP